MYRAIPQRYKQTSEKYQACLNIFHSECNFIFAGTAKIENNRQFAIDY